MSPTAANHGKPPAVRLAAGSHDSVVQDANTRHAAAMANTAVPSPAGGATDPTRPATSTAVVGQQSVVAVVTARVPDRYELLGEFGRGGIGRVSRAHDRELGRDVAIKELISHSHLNEIRFLREAMITA